ncbi:MAG TPA: amidase family protein [Streptosporangiaceae bacterium]|jgi:Asp-tRNA(Asn)/Glu-tRNA(Gln) amidotransferase A subunit family amidase
MSDLSDQTRWLDATEQAGLVRSGQVTALELLEAAIERIETLDPEAWGATRNPWNLAYSPGGSSGGAAAAVTSGMIPVAHASDGSGSIRIPAACCGVVGLKPSQGRISAGPSGDESGPGVGLCISRTIRDTAAMLDAVCGPGVGDAVIAPPPGRPYVRELSAVHQWWADGYDLLLTPATGEPPAPLGVLASDPGIPLAGSLSARYTAFTRAFNITGQPAISLPLGWSSAGLPIGVQLVAAYGREDLLINVAAQAEQARRWTSRKPPPLKPA